MKAEIKQGQNIVAIREKAALTQQQFADMISAELNRTPGFKLATVSSWEAGRRVPHREVVAAICRIFDVTEDYVLGKNYAEKYDKLLENTKASLSEDAIDLSELSSYYSLPVYVTFKNNSLADGWGIVSLDANGNDIIKMAQNTIKVNEDSPITVYARELHEMEVYYRNHQAPLGISKIINSIKPVWVSMLTHDLAVKAAYDGWYRVTEDKEFLVKDKRKILSLSGLNIDFKVYSEALYSTLAN